MWGGRSIDCRAPVLLHGARGNNWHSSVNDLSEDYQKLRHLNGNASLMLHALMATGCNVKQSPDTVICIPNDLRNINKAPR